MVQSGEEKVRKWLGQEETSGKLFYIWLTIFLKIKSREKFLIKEI